MYLIYNLLLALFAWIFLPFLLYRIFFKGKYRQSLKERFGFFSKDITYLNEEAVIWIHAVSVGETVAASPIVSEIKERLPDYKIVFSTVTETGQSMALQLINEADEIIYFPLDFSQVVRRVLKLINPELVIIIETELWPNFIKQADQMGAKIMLSNGRINDKSAKKYRYLGPLMKDMLDRIDILSMQSKNDKENIIALGADENKVYNNGNTKFDQLYTEIKLEKKDEFYKEFKLSSEQEILVIGSTHPNEEEILLPVYKELKKEFPELVMILAPRRVRRASEIEKLYTRAGVSLVRRTEIGKRNPESDSVILLDTIGELAQIYSIADLVFVGGSLVEIGGHNILEPVAHGKLAFFGPHMFNFKENVELALEYEVGIQVENAQQLTKKMLYFLHNRQELEAKSKKALEMIKNNKGAAKRNVKLATKLLGRELDERAL